MGTLKSLMLSRFFSLAALTKVTFSSLSVNVPINAHFRNHGLSEVEDQKRSAERTHSLHFKSISAVDFSNYVRLRRRIIYKSQNDVQQCGAKNGCLR